MCANLPESPEFNLHSRFSRLKEQMQYAYNTVLFINETRPTTKTKVKYPYLKIESIWQYHRCDQGPCIDAVAYP